MYKKVSIFVALAVLIILPFLLSTQGEVEILGPSADRKVTIVTRHSEETRSEFEAAFKDWFFRRYDERIDVDWRVLGGVQTIIRFINSNYENGFRLYWTQKLGKEWTPAVQQAFADSSIELPTDPANDTFEQSVRRSFLDAPISCGMDVFFGGGEIEVQDQARRGQLHPSRVFTEHPDWFDDNSIPQNYAGNIFWDEDHYWAGCCLSGFGIVYNRDVIRDLGIEHAPEQWTDLTDPRLRGQIAIADPTASGSTTKSMEMVFQQQMQQALAELKAKNPDLPESELEAAAVREGWLRGLGVIQKVAANASYFSESATRILIDVSSGSCAAGMTIDNYGLFQENNLRERSGTNRFGFVLPKGGSIVSPDPISILRGAPNLEEAEAFMEFTLSLEGQQLWFFEKGVEGGPKNYTIARPAIRREIYSKENEDKVFSTELNFYKEGAILHYRPEWTAPYSKAVRMIIRAIFLDPQPELIDAWVAINRLRAAGFDEEADHALAMIEDFDGVTYDEVINDINPVLKKLDKLELIQLQARLTRKFDNQYTAAAKYAEQFVGKR